VRDNHSDLTCAPGLGELISERCPQADEVITPRIVALKSE
jgi:hypothetical protein